MCNVAVWNLSCCKWVGEGTKTKWKLVEKKSMESKHAWKKMELENYEIFPNSLTCVYFNFGKTSLIPGSHWETQGYPEGRDAAKDAVAVVKLKTEETQETKQNATRAAETNEYETNSLGAASDSSKNTAPKPHIGEGNYTLTNLIERKKERKEERKKEGRKEGKGRGKRKERKRKPGG